MRLLLAALLCALCGCARPLLPPPERPVTVEPAPAPLAAPRPLTTPAVPPAPPSPTAEERAVALLSSLSLEQKVGQLLMVGFSGTQVDPDVAELVRGRQVGGVCLFKRNLVNAEQIAQLNDELRALLEDAIPPFIAVDQEGGNVVRVVDRTLVLPGNMALGATRSPQLAYQAGREQAQDLRRLGFNMNFAPVLDVNLNPKNPVIGIRSFGDDPGLVAQLGAEFVRGQQEAGLVTVAKHFPGHGSTDADSHRELPVMRESPDEVRAQLAPFEAAMKAQLDGLMTAHIAVPALTGNSTPATLSPTLLGRLLRTDLGFDGLVITDELEMEAIARRYGVGRAAVMALLAGADMVLIPWRPEKKREVHQALLEAARTGELPVAALNEAVRRILTVKLRRGLFEPPTPRAYRLEQLGERRALALEIAQSAVTLLRADAKHFPLSKQLRVGVVTAERSLAEAVEARVPGALTRVVPAYPSAAARASARTATRQIARASDVVVVGVINSRQLELVSLAAAQGVPVVVVTLGLPYYGEHVRAAKAVLAVYSYRASATEAAAAALFGEHGTPGRLPVRLPSFAFGHRLDPVGEQRQLSRSEPDARSHRER